MRRHNITIVPFHMDEGSESHANMLIIDKAAQTYERFEPYGRCASFDWIDKELKSLVRFWQQDSTETWKFMPPFEYCPVIGPQRYVDANILAECEERGGLCVLYRDLYAHLRILNPRVPRSVVIRTMMSLDRFHLVQWLLRYQTMMYTWLHITPRTDSYFKAVT